MLLDKVLYCRNLYKILNMQFAFAKVLIKIKLIVFFYFKETLKSVKRDKQV